MFKIVFCVINYLVFLICVWLFYYKNIVEDNECFINYFMLNIVEIYGYVLKNIKFKFYENIMDYEKKYCILFRNLLNWNFLIK